MCGIFIGFFNCIFIFLIFAIAVAGINDDKYGCYCGECGVELNSKSTFCLECFDCLTFDSNINVNVCGNKINNINWY